MKVPLRYQVTRNDCGPTSMTNALSYLLEREEFPPDVLEYVYSVMLDKYRGADHPGGTSCWAMRFFGHWLNDTRRTVGLPIEAHQLRGEEVQIGDGTPFVECVEQGGVAVNDVKGASIDVTFDQEQFSGDGVIIKKGKKVFHRAFVK